MSTLRTTAGARWDCSSCGDCCRFYELGPVEPEIIRGLQERKVEEHWQPAAEQPWFESRFSPSGQEVFFLTHRDGHCVFLRDDQLCAIHGLWGAEAKPSFCREYPMHIVESSTNTAVIVRPSCTGYHRSYFNGRSLDAHIPELMSVPRQFYRRQFNPETVPVLPNFILPLARWQNVEQELLAEVSDERSPTEAIFVLRAKLIAWSGEPAPDTDPQRARLAAGAIFEGLRRLMTRAIEEENAEPHRREFAITAVQLLEQALQGQQTLREISPETAAWERDLIRSFLLANGWQVYGGVAEGLGMMLLQDRLIRSLAGTGEVPVSAAGSMIAVWTRLIENRAVIGILKLTRPALLDLFFSDQR